MADPNINNILGERAAFAQNFIGTTNLAQRRRYQEDIQAAQQEEEQQVKRQFGLANQRAELADPLKARTIRLNERKALDQADQFDQRMTAEERRFQLKMQKDQEVLSLRERQAEITERKELRSAKDARRILENTEAVESAEEELRNQGILPGHPEYAKVIGEKVIRNPYIDPGYRKVLLEQANIKGDPDKIMRMYTAKGTTPVITTTINADGEVSYTFREPSEVAVDPDKRRRELERDLDRVDKGILDPAMKPYRDKRLKSIRDELSALDAPKDKPGQTSSVSPVIPPEKESIFDNVFSKPPVK